MTHKRRAIDLTGGARFYEFCSAGDHADGQHIISRRASLAAAPKNTVLGQTATHGGEAARQRAPVGRPHAQGHQMFVELLPTASRFDSNVAVFKVDLYDAVHRGHINKNAFWGSGEVATGVTHTAASRNDRCAALSAGCNQRLHLFDATGPDDRADGRSDGKYVLRIKRNALGVGIENFCREQLRDTRNYSVHICLLGAPKVTLLKDGLTKKGSRGSQQMPATSGIPLVV